MGHPGCLGSAGVAAPLVVGGGCGEAGADGVLVDVVDFLVVGLGVDEIEVVVAGFPDGHRGWMGGFVFDPTVEVWVHLLHRYGVALLENLEDRGDGSLLRFGKDEVDVVGHEDPGFQLCFVPGCRLEEDLVEEVS